jgi:FkbM family methyltransferase
MATPPISETLVDLLKPAAPTSVVDIGANPIHEIPVYQDMLARGICTVVGFEPQEKGLAELNLRKGAYETYLPYAVGDGKPGKLTLCHAPGMSSLLEPNSQVLDCLSLYSVFTRVTGEMPIETRRLDDIAEIAKVDFLKVDVQGSEMAIFRGGRSRLRDAVAVQTEVCLMELYKGQALFGEIDREMRALGFVPHIFSPVAKALIVPFHFEKDHYRTINHAIFRDVTYVRDFTRPDEMSAEQLKQLALLSHYCFGSFDLAAKCIRDLERRSAVASGAIVTYAQGLFSG